MEQQKELIIQSIRNISNPNLINYLFKLIQRVI